MLRTELEQDYVGDDCLAIECDLVVAMEAQLSDIRVGVDSQIWHMPRPTGLTGRVDRLDRSGLYSPSRIRFFVKSPHAILLVKGYVFPTNKYKG